MDEADKKIIEVVARVVAVACATALAHKWLYDNQTAQNDSVILHAKNLETYIKGD